MFSVTTFPVLQCLQPNRQPVICWELPVVLKAFLTAMAIRNDCVPPTLNLDSPDSSMAGLDLVPQRSQHKTVTHALCNGLGFGGVNAAIVLNKV